MLVCVDVGNTTIKVGLFKQEKLSATLKLETKMYRTEDEYGIRLAEGLKYHKAKPEDINGVIIASVVPTIDETLSKAFIKYFNQKPLFVAPGIKTGMSIKLDNPKQLGSDLIAGAVSAVNKYEAPCIIIDMGTAITLSVVNSKSQFIGGIIYPGIMTAYNSLIKNTSLLEAAQIKVPTNIVGRDTISSIQSGMIYGSAGAIKSMVNDIISEEGPMKVIITGGSATHLLPFLSGFIYDEHLVLEGLRLIYEKNKT